MKHTVVAPFRPSLLSACCCLCLLTGLSGCGDPNVPLTRPPDNAFRVSSPRPRRIDRPAVSRSSPTPVSRSGPELAQVTAAFLDIPWQTRVPHVRLMGPTAAFLQIPLPVSVPTPGGSPRPQPSPSLQPSAPQLPIDVDGLDLERLETMVEGQLDQLSDEQQEALLQQIQDRVQTPSLPVPSP